jgi:tRNA-specific 2-thiouridylase
MNKGKVTVGMSGGVDSSVAAALLLEEGYQVEGVFMKNWSPATLQGLTDCPWEADLEDAQGVAAQLGIPFHSVNFEKEYQEKVLSYFFAEYERGRTPNPDILCNKEIKFRVFLERALAEGAAAIATGHYARLAPGETGPELHRGIDGRKDQSYFLYSLGREALSQALFPIGTMQKEEVRKLATKLSLRTAAKPDSQGICFIGHLDVRSFLQDKLGVRRGRTYLLAASEGHSLVQRVQHALPVGEHGGSMYYTQGQRAGAIVDNGLIADLLQNRAIPVLYVVGSRQGDNALFVSPYHDDPALYSSILELESMAVTGVGDASGDQLISTIDTIKNLTNLAVQTRYQQSPTAITSVEVLPTGAVRLVASSPIWAVTPGQSAVIYQGSKVIGGGVICRTEQTILFE